MKGDTARAAATRHLSLPLASMLSSAGLSIDDIDAAITGQVERGLPPVLRAGHPQVRRICDTTGLNVMSLARRYRRLLVEIEEKEQRGVWWIYRECNRATSLFLCGSLVPDTALTGLAGRPLSMVADPPCEIGTAVVQSAAIVDDSWLSVVVLPRWIQV